MLRTCFAGMLAMGFVVSTSFAGKNTITVGGETVMDWESDAVEGEAKQDQASQDQKSEADTDSSEFSVVAPEPWVMTPTGFKNLQSFVLPGKGRLMVTTEERQSTKEAIQRLAQIATEIDTPTSFVEIGGWPALERAFEAELEKVDQKHINPLGGPVFAWHATTVIAQGNRLIRIDTILDPDVPKEITEKAQSIGRQIVFKKRGKSALAQKQIRALKKWRQKWQQQLKKRKVKTSQPKKKRPVTQTTKRAMTPAQFQQSFTPRPPIVYTPPNTPVTVETVTGNAVPARTGVGELYMAVSDDNQDVVIGTNAGRAYSNDGGVTYIQAGAPFPGVPTSGDPSVTVGASGNFYYALIGNPNGNAASGGVTGCSTALGSSADGGASFTLAGHAAFSALGPSPAVFFADQPFIAADRVNQASGNDQLYAVWRHFGPPSSCTTPANCPTCRNAKSGTGQSGITCSSDGGATWSAAQFWNGARPRVAVGPDGFVYAIYLGAGNDLMLNKYSSCSNGLVAQPSPFPVTIASGISGVNCPIPGLDRCSRAGTSSHMVAVDDVDPNLIFVGYANNTVASGNTAALAAAANEDIIVGHSIDGGANWSGGRRINAQVQGRRFMPWVCATNGAAFVSWYDRRTATTASSDSTDFFVGSAYLKDGQLRTGPETNLSLNPDPQCATGWPCRARAANLAETCSVQPQLAGRCRIGGSTGAAPAGSAHSNNACDSTTGPACPAGETCTFWGGCPKYGDYNGNACNDGRVFVAWASATAPPGVVAPGAGLNVYAARLPSTSGSVLSDFNNDGFADIAVGVAGEGIGNKDAAGAVNVIYGSAGGLAVPGNKIWHQDTSNIDGKAEAGDLFGFSSAAGDFDGDGFADLAIGAQHESVENKNDAGAVNVIYGTQNGLASNGDQLWHQKSANIKGTSETNDRFGYSLATGYFNNDIYADLAIGVPGEDVGNIDSAGAVNVIYGSQWGLRHQGNQLWYQGNNGIQDSAEQANLYGHALATGDFNGDDLSDLAIGVLGEGPGGAGAVSIIYGSHTGLKYWDNQLWTQDSANIKGAAEPLDGFGASLATGYFNNDIYADLAIGVNREGIGNKAEAGAVNIIYGSAAGLTAAGNQLWHQDSTNIAGASEIGDKFGSALAVGDINNDGFSDLVVGVPNEDIGNIVNAGLINVIYGSAGGLTAQGNIVYWLSSEAGDRYGQALSARDLNGDGFADIVIGIPNENFSGLSNAGMVSVLYGSPAGLITHGERMFHQDTPGIEGKAENNDNFGGSL